MHPAGLVRLLGCLRTEYRSQFNLVPRAHDPSGLWQESRALARPDFLSMRRVLVSYYQPIRFARFDGKSVNRGLPVLDKARALDSHTAVKRGARAQFPPKLSLNKVLNCRKFSLSSPKLRQSLKS